MVKAFMTVNWLSILLAAVVAWVFGAVYYGALGKLWVAAQGKTMEQFKQEQAAKFGKLSAQVRRSSWRSSAAGHGLGALRRVGAHERVHAARRHHLGRC